jgi:peptide chain release factor 3
VGIQEEVKRRRTFAIISHPDAGKTTLTEKLLLYGGAIHAAGSVKARKTERHAVSDWMEIEKQRGISVTSSVMLFDYNGYRINILDTPGHQDFSEDTYRTLVAADSAVMLIDAAKGVEQQTIKLFQVCRKRNIPIFTFVNKLDRAGKNPFDLMDELETVLGIRACPMNWPIGTDGDFKGVYHRESGRIELFSGGNHGMNKVESVTGDANDPQFKEILGEYHHNKLIDEIELLDVAGDEFDLERVLSGNLTPMFFGSAMNNFGVQPFLEKFLEITTPPTAREADTGVVDPEDNEFSGFVFKIQANMNPAHRDRVAFMRICSGRFEKGMSVKLARTDKELKLAQPQQFMAQERETVEEAFAGDIIGLFDPGIFALGDTVYTGKKVQFAGIPVFAPEHFARIKPVDTMKRKQFLKGITQLAQEGAIQVFKDNTYAAEEIIVGVVGVLQFEVLEHRLRHEYNVEISSTQLAYRFIRWLPEDWDIEKLKLSSSTKIGKDLKDRPVVLFENDWSMRWAEENNKGLVLSDVSDR